MLRRTILAAAVMTGIVAFQAHAATEALFTPAAFEAAQKAGKPILVKVDASWCPNCAKQRPILSELAKDPAFATMTMLTVDFDSQKDVLKQLNVQKQSTLIVFAGTKELARSTGETDAAKIRALLETGKS
jgi:thioredoxin-like negative regulator of GroEL